MFRFGNQDASSTFNTKREGPGKSRALTTNDSEHAFLIPTLIR